MGRIEDLFDNSVISTSLIEGYVMVYNFSSPYFLRFKWTELKTYLIIV